MYSVLVFGIFGSVVFVALGDEFHGVCPNGYLVSKEGTSPFCVTGQGNHTKANGRLNTEDTERGKVRCQDYKRQKLNATKDASLKRQKRALVY